MRALAALLLLLAGWVPLGDGNTLLMGGYLPTIPGTAFQYTNLQMEDSSCPSYSGASQTSALDCWTADSKDATALAGAGIVTPTLLNFNIASPSLSGAAMQASVSNAPPQSVSATGTSGAYSVVVSSVTGIGPGATVTGTGIGASAAIASSWDGASTTIPLTVPNTGTVNGTITFTNTFVSNSLFYRNLPCTVLPTTPGDVTTGTLTVHAGTITLSGSTLTLSGMTATDTASTVTAIQVYLDGSGTPAYDNGPGASPHSPASYTVTLSKGRHTYAVKAFNSAGGSSVTTQGKVSIGGATCGLFSHMLSDFKFFLQGGNTPQAYEWDPGVIVGGYEYFGSMQCRVVGTNSGQWFFWNSWAGGTVGGSPVPYGAWVLQPGATYPCPTPTANAWHHYQLYITYDLTGHTYRYQTLLLDGVVIFHDINLQFNAQPGQDPSVTVANFQYQMDDTAATPRTGPGNTEYLDQPTLSMW